MLETRSMVSAAPARRITKQEHTASAIGVRSTPEPLPLLAERKYTAFLEFAATAPHPCWAVRAPRAHKGRMADKKGAAPRDEGDLLVGARLHVRTALAKRLVAGALTPPSAPLPAPSTPTERMLDDFLVGRGLHVTRSVIWPEATRVAGAGGAAAVGGRPGADAPLEAAADLYNARTHSRDSCVQTDSGAMGLDPMSSLGEAKGSCKASAHARVLA